MNMENENPVIKDFDEDFCANRRSNWDCYLFGNRHGGGGLVYSPAKENVPNCFVRWMMKICFDCKWVKRQERQVGECIKQ